MFRGRKADVGMTTKILAAVVIMLLGLGVYFIMAGKGTSNVMKTITSAGECGSGGSAEFCAVDLGSSECPPGTAAVPDPSCPLQVYSSAAEEAKMIDQKKKDFKIAVDEFEKASGSKFSSLRLAEQHRFMADYFGYCCKEQTLLS